MSRASILRFAALVPCVLASFCAPAASPSRHLVEPPALAGIPIDFILFALTLIGIALFHRHTLPIAVTRAGRHLAVEDRASRRFRGPRLPRLGCASRPRMGDADQPARTAARLRAACPSTSKRAACRNGCRGSCPTTGRARLVLLVMIFVLSSFLDNIAAALIGGTIARAVFRGKVHMGYLAAIVAASNAGGSGSVVGDTTTTMMWIDGVHPLQVLEAYIAAGTAMLVFGVPAALQQQRYSPIVRDPPGGIVVDWARVFIVALMLVAAIAVNVIVNVRFNEISGAFPFIGAAVWVALLVCVPLRRPAWEELPDALKGSIFLLSLVLAASMMPVHKLPDASWRVALGWASSPRCSTTFR